MKPFYGSWTILPFVYLSYEKGCWVFQGLQNFRSTNSFMGHRTFYGPSYLFVEEVLRLEAQDLGTTRTSMVRKGF